MTPGNTLRVVHYTNYIHVYQYVDPRRLHHPTEPAFVYYNVHSLKVLHAYYYVHGRRRTDLEYCDPSCEPTMEPGHGMSQPSPSPTVPRYEMSRTTTTGRMSGTVTHWIPRS